MAYGRPTNYGYQKQQYSSYRCFRTEVLRNISDGLGLLETANFKAIWKQLVTNGIQNFPRNMTKDSIAMKRKVMQLLDNADFI